MKPILALTIPAMLAVALAAGFQSGGVTPQNLFPAELHGSHYPSSRIMALSHSLRRSVLFVSGDTEITLRYGERLGSGEEWSVLDRLETVPFQITAVGSRQGGDELYVAGINAKGRSKIQRWIMTPREGGYYVRWLGSEPSPIGTPMPPFAAEELVNGALFQDPSLEDYGPPQKEELMESPSFGHVRDLLVDPEGRFLLILSFPEAAIHRVDLLAPSPQAEVLFATGQIPHLSKVRTMQLFQNPALGRVCVLTEVDGSVVPLGARRTLLIDANNDANFESVVTLTQEEWVLAGYEDPALWQRHWNLGQTFDW
jgi:hypothetical protein